MLVGRFYSRPFTGVDVSVVNDRRESIYSSGETRAIQEGMAAVREK